MNRKDQFDRCTELAQDLIDLHLSQEKYTKDKKTFEAIEDNLNSLVYLLSELKQGEEDSYERFYREDD